MKKRIQLFIAIFMIVTTMITTNVKAYTVDTTARASIVFDNELPYHYEGEEKERYKMLSYKAGTELYCLGRNETSVMTRFTNVEKYNDDILERILENGYPAKTEQELGVNTKNEAYFATQEAIYAYLENRHVDRYIAENEEGQRIIASMVNILEKAKQEEVSLVAIDTEWKVDQTNPDKRYKKYQVLLPSNLESVNIALENEVEVQVCDSQNQEITTVRNGDIMKIIMPKGMNQTFQVKLLYEKQGSSIYRIYNISNTNLQYLLSVEENFTKEKVFEINFQNLAQVTITNDAYETKEPIVGSEFTILNSSYKAIQENLITDESGKINTFLEQGKYFLKQTKVKDGYSLAEQMVSFEIKKIGEVNLNVSNAKEKQEQIEQEKTQTNLVQENKKILETDVNNITNIHQTNIEREVIKQTNETNFENINNFVNTIYKKNIDYVTSENTYQNNIWQETVIRRNLPGRNITTNMFLEDYEIYKEQMKNGSLEIPNLPVAIKQ